MLSDWLILFAEANADFALSSCSIRASATPMLYHALPSSWESSPCRAVRAFLKYCAPATLFPCSSATLPLQNHQYPDHGSQVAARIVRLINTARPAPESARLRFATNNDPAAMPNRNPPACAAFPIAM